MMASISSSSSGSTVASIKLYRLSEIDCLHEKYSAKIGDYIFLQMKLKVVKLIRSQGFYFILFFTSSSMCLFQNATVCIAIELALAE